jgi:hypothetical protein
MTEEHDAPADRGEERLPEGYPGWRRVHLLASWLVTGVGLAHLGVAAFTFDAWTAQAVVLVVALVAQVIAGRFTMPGPG